jgi:hypothetical protein
MQQMSFIADLIACSTCFGHHYAHHQELESIIQVVAACGICCFGFQVVGMVWSWGLYVRFAGSQPETCWASNKICNKTHLLHLVDILFPHINEDARSKPHQNNLYCQYNSVNDMGSHNVCTDWMYRYLAWWWLSEPKHVAEFLMLITNICCVYWLNKLLYYCKTQQDGCCQRSFLAPDLSVTDTTLQCCHLLSPAVTTRLWCKC